MIVHRFAAIALAVSLVHLNVVRADVACGRHGQQAPQAEMADQSAHHGAAHTASVPDAATPVSDDACDVPAQTDCCQALVSCSPTIASDSDVLMASLGSLREGALSASIDVPLSRVSTPDPPPPKA